jgi:hypothetical protein
VEYDAHLFVLQIHASSLETGWQEEMALLFSVQHGMD